MDSEEDLTPRYLLRGILNNDLLSIRSPVTRRTSAEAQRSRNSERLSAGLRSDSGAQSTSRSTRKSARLRGGAGAPTLTPQEALRRSLKQKLCESTARTSLPGSNRKTTANVPVQPAATSDRGSSRASTRLSDLEFSRVTLPAADQSERPLKRKRPPRIIDITAFEKRLNQESAVSLGEAARKEPAMPTASAIICGISPSSGQSELDLSYVPMPGTDKSVRGLRRKRPRRILNVSAFEERLSQDTDGRASPSPTASTTLSGVTLSLKTPHTGARTEKKALQRRAPQPHQFSVEAFEEGVLSQTVGNSDGGGSRVFSKAARSNDLTLNLSDAEPECTIDFFNHATTLYAQSSVMGATIPITATKDKATVMASRIQRDTGDEADGEISQDEEMEVECSKLIRRQSSSYPPAEGGEDVSVESQPEEEDAAAHSPSDEGASQTEDEAVEVQHGVESQTEGEASESQPEGEEAESLPEDAAVSQTDEEAHEAHDQSEETREEEPGSQTDEEEEPEVPESLPEEEEAESLPEDATVSTDEEAHESQTGDQLDEAPEVEPGSQTDEEEAEAPESQQEEEVPVDQMEEEAVLDSQSEEDNEKPETTIEGTPRQPSHVSRKIKHRAFRSVGGGRMPVAVEGRRDYRSMGAVPKAPEVEPGSQTDEEEPEAPESQTDDEEVPVDQMEEEAVPDSQSEEEDNWKPEATIEGTPRQPSRVSGKLNHRAFCSEGGGHMSVAVEGRRDSRSMGAVPKAPEVEPGSQTDEEEPEAPESQTDDEEVPVDQMEEEAVPDSQSEEEDNRKPEATIEGTPRQPSRVSGKLNHRAFRSEGGGRRSVAVEGGRDRRSMGAVPKAPEVEPGSQTDEEEPEAPESQTDDEEVPVDQMGEEAVPDSQSEEEDNGIPEATLEGTPRQPSRVSGKLNHRAFRSEGGGRMPVAVEGGGDRRSMRAVPKATEAEWTGNESAGEGPSKRHSGPHLTGHVSGTSAQMAGDLADQEEWEDEENDHEPEDLSMKTPAFVRAIRKGVVTKPQSSPTVLRDIQPSVEDAASVKPKKRTAKTGGEKKREPPSIFTKSYCMGNFKHFAKTKVSSDVYPVLKETMEKFFDRMVEDLETYANHAKRKTIEVEDVVLLLKRQGHVTDKVPVEVLIEKYLDMSARKELIPCASSGNVVFPKSIS